MKDELIPFTHEEYVTKAQAIALKTLGFDWWCCGVYAVKKNKSWILFPPRDHNSLDGSVCSAPILAQAARWLREKHNIVVSSLPSILDSDTGVYKYRWAVDCVEPEIHRFEDFFYPSYEAALSAGIDSALGILKEENNGNQN